MRMNRMAALTMGAGMITMAACSDSPTAPTANAFVPKTTSFAVGDVVSAAVQLGKVIICKTGNANGTFNLSNQLVVADAPSGAPTASQVTVATTTCEIAYEDANPTNGNGTRVTITEVPAANTVQTLTTCSFRAAGDAAESPCSTGTADLRFINAYHGYTITYNNAFTPPTGNEGCTPGYWKQDQHAGNWPISRATTFAGVGITTVSGTLLSALSRNGGGLDALARAAAAGYLNAASGDVDYAYTTAQVVAIANGTGAYSGLSVEARKNLLDAANNGLGGCPLARAEAAN